MKKSSYSFSKGIRFAYLKGDVSSDHPKIKYIGVDRRKTRGIGGQRGLERGYVVHGLSSNRVIDINKIKKSRPRIRLHINPKRFDDDELW